MGLPLRPRDRALKMSTKHIRIAGWGSSTCHRAAKKTGGSGAKSTWPGGITCGCIRAEAIAILTHATADVEIDDHVVPRLLRHGGAAHKMSDRVRSFAEDELKDADEWTRACLQLGEGINFCSPGRIEK